MMFANKRKLVEWDIYKDGKRMFQERAWGTEEHLAKMRKKVEKMYKGCEVKEEYRR